MRKVLVIAYYWPPAGGPGVQRWLKFVKYLPDFGFQPIVYIPENANYPILDESLLKAVPEGIRIIKQPISEPYRWASVFSAKNTKRISSGIITEYEKQSPLERLMLWIRGNFFIPDARKSWVKPSVKFLSELIQNENIKDVITTGPPHSLHLIGVALKKKYPKIQWITDFRDPWTSIGYHKKLKLTNTSRRKHQALEHEVLNNCDKIVVTSQTTQKEFEKLTKTPTQVITNGYDGDPASVDLDEAFTLSHIGSLLTGRNPMPLWKILAELVQENPNFKKALKIKLVGVVSDQVQQSIRSCGLSAHLEKIGYVPHEEVQKLQSQSQVLLMTEIDSEETQGIIPGKFFEYLQAKRPILAIGPEKWEAGLLVKSTKSGAYFSHINTDELKALLLKWFAAYQKHGLTVKAEGIENFSRKALTKKLNEFIVWES